VLYGIYISEGPVPADRALVACSSSLLVDPPKTAATGYLGILACNGSE